MCEDVDSLTDWLEPWISLYGLLGSKPVSGTEISDSSYDLVNCFLFIGLEKWSQHYPCSKLKTFVHHAKTLVSHYALSLMH